MPDKVWLIMSRRTDYEDRWHIYGVRTSQLLADSAVDALNDNRRSLQFMSEVYVHEMQP